jgi:hypothetical protein
MTDLAANALTTLDAVKTELGIDLVDTTHDDYLKHKINVASQAIEDYCDRSFGSDEVTETFPAEGQLLLVVSRPPITEIDSITIDDVEIESANYEIEGAGAGKIRLLYGGADVSLQAHNLTADRMAGTARYLYSVTYTGGYVLPSETSPTLPATIEEACIQQVVTEYRQKGKDRSITAERLLSWNATYATTGQNDSGLAPHVLAKIKRYKRIYV